MKVPTKDLAVTEGKLAVEIPDELKELFAISGNMEGVTPRLPQIKIIHRGQMFEMPDDSKITSFEGIILDQHPANAWWEKDMSESGGAAIPDCFSMDAMRPDPKCENRQFENCKDCPQNQFGSDSKTGKGKACKNMKRLHIIMEGSTLPRRLTIPPTSIKSFELYMTGLVDRGLPYAAVVSMFTLDKKETEAFEYSEVKILKERVCEKDELFSVADFIRQFRDDARKQEIHADEYQSSNSEAKAEEPESDIPF